VHGAGDPGDRGGVQVREIASLQRETSAVEALGLILAEGKALLAGLQEVLVAAQAARLTTIPYLIAAPPVVVVLAGGAVYFFAMG